MLPSRGEFCTPLPLPVMHESHEVSKAAPDPVKMRKNTYEDTTPHCQCINITSCLLHSGCQLGFMLTSRMRIESRVQGEMSNDIQSQLFDAAMQAHL